MTALHRARTVVAHAEDVAAQWNRITGRQLLLILAHEVVDVVQAAVLDEQHVPTMTGALLVEHTLGTRAVDGNLRQD